MSVISRKEFESILRDVVSNCNTDVLVRMYNALPDWTRHNVQFNWDLPDRLEDIHVKEDK